MAGDDLKDFIETAGSVSPFRVEDDFGNGFVRLRTEEAERRQAAHDIRSSEDIVIEALRNARDAHARTIFLATAREGSLRRIVVLDDGDGVPPSMQERIFEPRVTSKLDSAHMDKWGVHGRGMALYSITVNCVTARVAVSNSGLGSSFEFVCDTAALGEKRDQSTFPTFTRTETGAITVRGPRNILRTACEFAVDSTRTCTLYLGAPAEIAATLYAFGMASLSAAERAFTTDLSRIEVCKRLATCADAASFASVAVELGLPLSERTCRRILDGEIKSCDPLVERIVIEDPREAHRPARKRRSADVMKDARGLRIAQEDLESFSGAVAEAYRSLAQDYYLDPSVTPEVRVGKDRILVSVPVRKL